MHRLHIPDTGIHYRQQKQELTETLAVLIILSEENRRGAFGSIRAEAIMNPGESKRNLFSFHV